MSAADTIRSFKLSDSFLDEYRDKQPAWGFNGLGYVVYKRCVQEDTPVLCADLIWRQAGTLVPGDKLLAFEEGSTSRQQKNKLRHLCTAEVTHNSVEDAECVEILLSNGEKLVCTPDHSWLVQTEWGLEWVEAKDLTSRKNVTLIKYFDVWEPDTTYLGGYLAGIFDGEGSLSKRLSLEITQTEGPVLSKILEILDDMDVRYTMSDKQLGKLGKKPCKQIRMYGMYDVAKILGTIYPRRLVPKFAQYATQALKNNQERPEVTVVSVTPVGTRRIAVLSTSAKTHFTAGYASHNTYARTKPDGQLEEFWETCKRVVEGTYDVQKKHCKNLRLPWDDRKAQRSAQEMYRRMWAFKWLPPGRGLWMMGAPVIERLGGAATNNCGFVSTKGISIDFADPFCWLMDMLMLGVGVGFDTKGAGVVKIQAPQTVNGTFVVDDSREGWVSLLRIYLDAHVGRGAIPSTIDYSKVRPLGAPINGFGGVASGPEPLKELVYSISTVLEPLHGQTITASAIVDICNLIGRCVVAGNVRRSAEIAFGEPGDEEFLNLKNPDLNQTALMHHRWASNNSVFATVGMDYSKVAALTAKNGEPGYQWLDNAREYGRMGGVKDFSDMRVAGANPCVEQSLEDRELCCLVETFPGLHDSFEDFKKTLKYAYLYAKTVTLMPTHDDRTNTVMMRNRRIGCSMSGITQAMQKFGRRNFFSQFCDAGYKYLRELDQVYAEWLCVRPSIKITSVKPSGTVSLLPGVTPGIHFPHARYYIRRVRLQDTSPLVQKLKDAGYPVEADKYSPNTVVVSFPVEERNFDRSKDDVTLWEQLELAAQMQQFWADNQVSVTVTFKPSEAKDIKYALEMYETRLKGVSFLPLEDHGYEQAPYETISPEQYATMIYNITPIDTSGATHETTSRFCDGETCLVG